MTRRVVGVFVAAAFAIGLISGLSGAAVAQQPAPAGDCAAQMADHMAGSAMGSMMSGSMDSMMSGAMGPGAMGSMGPAALGQMPGGQHESHHPVAPEDGRR